MVRGRGAFEGGAGECEGGAVWSAPGMGLEKRVARERPLWIHWTE